jgi:hypothetical protein
LGAVLMPILPATLEHAAECTYPIPADSSSSLLLVMANVVSMLLTFALTPLLAMPVSANCSAIVTPASGLIFFSMVLGVVLVIPVKKDYRRMAAEAATHATATAAAAASYSAERAHEPEVRLHKSGSRRTPKADADADHAKALLAHPHNHVAAVGPLVPHAH